LRENLEVGLIDFDSFGIMQRWVSEIRILWEISLLVVVVWLTYGMKKYGISLELIKKIGFC
jgi:hypothetical protein